MRRRALQAVAPGPADVEQNLAHGASMADLRSAAVVSTGKNG
jgi:hypothetical protein